MRLVPKGSHEGGLDRCRYEHPGVLAHLGDRADQIGVPGEEGRPVAGEVGLLGQGVQGEQTGPASRSPDPRVQETRDRLDVPRRLPGKLGVALVGDDDRAASPGPGDDPGQLLGVQDVPVGVSGAVEPDDGHARVVVDVPGGGVGVGVHGDRGGTHEASADVVGGVGGPRVQDEVPRSHAQVERQEGHGLLGTDRGDDLGLTQVLHASAAPHPLDDGGAHHGGADRRRVAGGVGCRGQGGSGDLRGGVDGRTHREVDDAVRVLGSALSVGAQRVPREVGQGEAAGQERAGEGLRCRAGTHRHRFFLTRRVRLHPRPPLARRLSSRWPLSTPRSAEAERRSSGRRSPGRRHPGRHRASRAP